MYLSNLFLKKIKIKVNFFFKEQICLGVRAMMLNATYKNISVISWRPVLLGPAFKSFDFDLMEIITETHRAQQIIYLRFYYCTKLL